MNQMYCASVFGMGRHGTGRMGRRIMACVFVAACMFLANAKIGAAKTMISDSAGLLSREEASRIESDCDLILQQHDTSVFVITTDKLGKSDDYQDYLKNQLDKAGSEENLVILFISVKDQDGVCQVVCHGKIQDFLTRDRMENMSNAVEGKVESGKYYQAIDGFCDDVTRGLVITPSLDGFIFQSLPQLILSLLLGCGTVFYFLRSAKREKTSGDIHLPQGNFRDLGHLDHFSHKEVNILKDKKSTSE